MGGRGEWKEPKRGELPPEIDTALSSCGLVRDPGGALHATLETEGEEILDVRMEGGEAEQRRCAVEALWDLSLPAEFNHLTFKRLEYPLALSPKSAAAPK